MSDTIRRSIGMELRTARQRGGLSIAAVAAAVGLSKAEASRIERGLAPWLTIEAVCRIAVVVGMSPSVRLYEAGMPLRDAAHAALLGRLRNNLPAGLRWQPEVPMPGHGDQRAWDAGIFGKGWWIAVEGETRLTDLQALQRRIALKRRDSGDPPVLLLVNDTRPNREVLAAEREALRTDFPLDGRALLSALRSGRPPAGGGVLRL
ncbi:MAG TPA: helix-turn-helix transcriptional regulator [Candidatus Limnocylindrales bacterium]